MQLVCNDTKGMKHVGHQPNIISQLHRAFKRYPDCDQKRSEPCKETKQNARKT